MIMASRMLTYHAIIASITEYRQRQREEPEALFINAQRLADLRNEMKPRLLTKQELQGERREKVAGLWVYLDESQESFTVGRL